MGKYSLDFELLGIIKLGEVPQNVGIITDYAVNGLGLIHAYMQAQGCGA